MTTQVKTSMRRVGRWLGGPAQLVFGFALVFSTLLAASVGRALLIRAGASTVAVFCAVSLLGIGYAFAVYLLFVARVEHRAARELLLSDGRTALPLGFLQGAVLFGLAIGIITAAGAYQIVASGTLAGVAATFPLSLYAAVFQELLMRGIFFRLLEQMTGSWIALAVCAAIFGAAHRWTPGATWLSTAAIAIEAGVLMGAAFMRYRTLWVPMGLHLGWNFTQGGIFAAPISGGKSYGLFVGVLSGPDWLTGGEFGPEASVPALVLALLLAGFFINGALRRGRTFSRHGLPNTRGPLIPDNST